jgi:Holliday junction resolvase
MSIHRRAAKRDLNEFSIVDALRTVGADVYRLSAKGVPDLLVSFRGETFLMEIKTRTGKLTPAQIKWRDQWQGGPVGVVRTVDEALAFIGATS